MSLISYERQTISRISYELQATSYEFDFDFRRPAFSSQLAARSSPLRQLGDQS